MIGRLFGILIGWRWYDVDDGDGLMFTFFLA